MAAEYSMLLARLMFGSGLRSDRSPNVELELGPISLSCTMPSPLVGSTTPEQAVPAALMGQSNQFRFSLTSAEFA